MNNVIFILVDSVIWDCIGATRTKVSTTPFIDSLKDESITANKLFSYGPYTNAATRSLYTGRLALDDFGYYFQLNTSPTNHYKIFHENGYETYGFYYPYYIVGKEMRKHIDHTTYLGGFVFSSEWIGIFEYYSKLKKSRKLEDNELLILTERTRLLFEVWIKFCEDLLNDDESGFFLNRLIERNNISHLKDILENEHLEFDNNPISYVNTILDLGLGHKLSNLNTIDVDNLIDRDYLNKEIYLRYKTFFSKVDKNNRKANRWKNFPGLKRLFYGIVRLLKNWDSKEMMFVANYLLCIDAMKTYKKASQKHWQDIASARVQLWHAADIIENRHSEKPYFMSLHFLEPHNSVNFFSYDIQDKNAHEEEINVLSSYVDKLGTGFVGNLTYYLSIRYVDFCLEEFCNRLKACNQWENTTLVLVADHGSSYSFSPLHNAHVNCFDEECYHVPMVIRHPGIIKQEFNDYYNSKDVLPTLLDVLGIHKPKEMTGVSMFDKNYRKKDYVMTEYMGPGNPDMLHQRIWYSIRDNHYTVAYKVSIDEKFEDGELAEVYDLSKDPNAYYNVAENFDTKRISYLLSPLKKRHEELRNNTIQFIDDMKKGKINM